MLDPTFFTGIYLGRVKERGEKWWNFPLRGVGLLKGHEVTQCEKNTNPYFFDTSLPYS